MMEVWKVIVGFDLCHSMLHNSVLLWYDSNLFKIVKLFRMFFLNSAGL